MMISDPIIDKNRASGSGLLENLAMSRESSDIPTLIPYLKSTQVLKETAKNNNISPFALSKRLNIQIPRKKSNNLNRFYIYKDKFDEIKIKKFIFFFLKMKNNIYFNKMKSFKEDLIYFNHKNTILKNNLYHLINESKWKV